MTLLAVAQRRKHRPAGQTDGNHIVLHNVSWDTYEAIGDSLSGRPIRLNYDRGTLEIMTLSLEHERYKRLIGLLVTIIALEWRIAIGGGGSTTYRRRSKDRGLEPDECFYITNWPKVRGKKQIDLTRDPPPDLAIEVDIAHSSVDRMGIYASLAVGELWRFDGEKLRVFRLTATGRYQARARSALFPTLPVDKLVRFIRLGFEQDDTSMVLAFQKWLRRRVGKE
jgi:Uma2 family endonuclease